MIDIAGAELNIRALDMAVASLRINAEERCANCDFWVENDPRCMNGGSPWGGRTTQRDDSCSCFAKRVPEDMGEVSDGYHTFNKLYHHRAVLFSVICNQHPELAWKSLRHDDEGQPMYDGMFIVGVETPAGQATYHYDVDPYWDLFRVKELERASKWDGHTSEEAIQRIEMLGAGESCAGEWISVYDRLPHQGERVLATDGAFVGEMYINKREQWIRYNVKDSALMMALDILWWMPLPEPPKEENCEETE